MIAGPSGVGKGTVVREVLSRVPDGLVLSVSATTRPPRPGEVDGTDYYFVDDAGFDRMVTDGEMLEWAEVFHGHRYGTPCRTSQPASRCRSMMWCSRSTSREPAGYGSGFPTR